MEDRSSDNALMRSFYDSSLWESRKAEAWKPLSSSSATGFKDFRHLRFGRDQYLVVALGKIRDRTCRYRRTRPLSRRLLDLELLRLHLTLARKCKLWVGLS
jgi:hypothetical protein